MKTFVKPPKTTVLFLKKKKKQTIETKQKTYYNYYKKNQPKTIDILAMINWNPRIQNSIFF